MLDDHIYLADRVGHFPAEGGFWWVRQAGVHTRGHLLPAFSGFGLMKDTRVDGVPDGLKARFRFSWVELLPAVYRTEQRRGLFGVLSLQGVRQTRILAALRSSCCFIPQLLTTQR